MNFNDQDRQCVVTLSAAKGLSRWAERSFAALRMTGRDLSGDEELSRSFEPCLMFMNCKREKGETWGSAAARGISSPSLKV